MCKSKMCMKAVKCLSMFFVCLFTFVSCATRQDIALLNSRVSSIERRVGINLSRKMDTNLRLVRKQQARIVAEIEQLKKSIQNLTGATEDNRHLIAKVIEDSKIDDIKLRVSKLETEVKQIQKYLRLEPSDFHAQKESPSDSQNQDTRRQLPAQIKHEVRKSNEKKHVLTKKELYQSTLNLFKEGKYKAAIDGFRTFIKKYPHSGLADNAQFWIGECYMGMKQYERAILAYQDVIKKYPKGNKVSNAMLRQSFAFEAIGDKTSARLLLKKVVKLYPKSAEARIARLKLKKM